MRRYTRLVQAYVDERTTGRLDDACATIRATRSRVVRYAIQPYDSRELEPGDHDWNDGYRDDTDQEHPIGREHRITVMLTDDEHEMLCRAAYRRRESRSAYLRERVTALLDRDPAGELDGIDDRALRSNATRLLRELHDTHHATGATENQNMEEPHPKIGRASSAERNPATQPDPMRI